MYDTLLYHDVGKDPLYKTWHATSRPLFMYVYSDGGSIVTKERTFPIKKGALVYIAPGTYHYTMPEVPDIYDRSKLILSRQKYAKISTMLRNDEEYRDIFDWSASYAQIPLEEQTAVDGIFAEATACKNQDGAELVLLSSVLRLLYYFRKYAAESTAASVGYMSKAIQYINKNIGDPLDIDRVCQVVNMSKYHFCRQFKHHTGQTVMAYILNTRIALAKGELETTGISISQISEKYGFSSVSYFCRVFKEATGLTPLQYRRTWQK